MECQTSESGCCKSKTYFVADEKEAKKLSRELKKSGIHIVQNIHAKLSKSGKFEVKAINFLH